jgi:hypothetical protein
MGEAYDTHAPTQSGSIEERYSVKLIRVIRPFKPFKLKVVRSAIACG